MKNTNYAPEIATAHQWILDHNNDLDLHYFLRELGDTVNNSNYTHSDRWSMVYDWMAEHYPEATGSLITGITYWAED